MDLFLGIVAGYSLFMLVLAGFGSVLAKRRAHWEALDEAEFVASQRRTAGKVAAVPRREDVACSMPPKSPSTADLVAIAAR